MVDICNIQRYSASDVADIFADSDSENDCFQLQLSDSDKESSFSSDIESQEALSYDSNNEECLEEVDSEMDMLSAEKVCILCKFQKRF